jgi:hypothetical protein
MQKGGADDDLHGSAAAAGAPLTLGEAAAVLKEQRDLRWNAEPEARQVPQGPPQPDCSGSVAPADVEHAPGRHSRETNDDSSECL